MRPRLSAIQHLGLYGTFHRSRGNRLIHAFCVPVICGTGFALLAWMALWASPSAAGLFAAAILPVGVVAAMSLVDRTGALCLAGWLLPVCGLAAVAALELDLWPAMPVMGLVHGAAWFLAVDIGHERLEPPLVVAGAEQSTNYYFKQHYFIARGLGCATNTADAVIQFAIGLLGSTHELISALRFRSAFAAAVEHEGERIRDRLARGLPPFPDDRRRSPGDENIVD